MNSQVSLTEAELSGLQVSRHPLILHKLSILRDENTEPKRFREVVDEITSLLCYEATADLPVKTVRVRTPLVETDCQEIDARIGLVPILRSGLGMVDAVLDLVPQAEVWHLGFYRDEKTLQPVEYYKKIPSQNPVDVALVLDPMLATGGSAVAALDALKAWGVPRIKLLAMLAAPEGIEHIATHSPGTEVFVAAIDARLNEHGYIVPGLGDAGDRMFNAVAN